MILRVLDFECSGLTPPEAEVCEVGWCDVRKVDDDVRIVWSASYLCGVSAMPPAARAVHHITLDDVKGCDPFRSGGVLTGIDILVAHNMAYEAQFLGEHAVPTICSYKCALRVWPDAPGHSNSVLRYWLEDQGLLKLDHDKAMPPHRAGPDAYVTAHILLALLKHATVEEMVEWTREPRLLPKCPIGKFRGKPWAEVDYGFLTWMLKQPDMEADYVWNARRELDRRDKEIRDLPF